MTWSQATRKPFIDPAASAAISWKVLVRASQLEIFQAMSAVIDAEKGERHSSKAMYTVQTETQESELRKGYGEKNRNSLRANLVWARLLGYRHSVGVGTEKNDGGLCACGMEPMGGSQRCDLLSGCTKRGQRMASVAPGTWNPK